MEFFGTVNAFYSFFTIIDLYLWGSQPIAEGPKTDDMIGDVFTADRDMALVPVP